jgi:hypothetical protein
MKVINVVNDIRQFNVSENIYLDLKGRINFDTPYSNVREFVSFHHSVLLIGKEEKIINSFDFPNIPGNFSYKYNSASKNYFILVDSDSLDFETFICTKEAFYSIAQKKTISINDLAGNRIFYDYSVGQIGRTDYLFVIHIPSKTKITNFPLSKLGTWLDGAIEKPYQVVEFSGIYEKTLVCNLNSGAVLLLDIENAQSFTLLSEARFPRKMYPKKGEPNIYIGLMGRRYIEIDVISKKLIKEVSIEQQLRNIKNIPDEQTCWFSISFSVLYDELYYFICETNFIGVFDPREGKIIDYHEFEFDKKQYQQLKGGEENLQVKGGNIFCLDTLGDLYELER